MKLDGEYHYVNQEPCKPPVTITIGPMIAFIRPGWTMVERIGGDMEDATPQELTLIAAGEPVPWKQPNSAHVGTEDKP